MRNVPILCGFLDFQKGKYGAFRTFDNGRTDGYHGGILIKMPDAGPAEAMIDFTEKGSFQMKKKNKTLMIVLVIIMAALACLVGVLIYASKNVNISVNGIDTAGLSSQELVEKVAAEEEAKEIELKEGDQTELSGSVTAFGYTVNRDTLASKISSAVSEQKENPLALVKSLGSSLAVTVEPDWVFDSATFTEFVRSESFSTERRSTTQAGVVYDEASASYVASEYDAGNEIDDSKLQSVVKDAADKALGGSVSADDSASSSVSGSSDSSVNASGSSASSAVSYDSGSAASFELTSAVVSGSETESATGSSSDESVTSASSGSDDSASSSVYSAASAPSDVQVEQSGNTISITLPSSVYVVAEEETSTASAEELQSEAEMMNKYAGAKINYTFGDETVTLGFDTIRQWITYSNGQLTYDDEAMKQYISDLADKYNTRYRTRTFTTSYGTQITFDASDNEYGYKIDEDAELTQMKADIESGQEVTREPCYVSQNSYGNPLYLKRNGTDDLAGTYVEVDLTNQHLWFYKDGQLIVESDVVSGLPTSERETKTGVFPLAYKKSPATLSSDVNGYSVDVNYWMPFYEGQGLHDATWRSSFGGSIYQSDGSHGCVNLPEDVAATIYNNIEAGCAIVIYKS